MPKKSIKPTKVCYLVFGPESAGNRMMACSFDTAGIESPYSKNGEYISGPHSEPTYTENPLLISRSIPHGANWPDIKEIIQRAKDSNYEVFILVLTRIEKYMAESQVLCGRINFRHVDINTKEDALVVANRNIKRAKKLINNAVKGTNYKTISYERFVTDSNYRKSIFVDWLGLSEPTLEYYNANEKKEVKPKPVKGVRV